MKFFQKNPADDKMEEPWTIDPNGTSSVTLKDSLKLTVPENYTLDFVTNLLWSKVMKKNILLPFFFFFFNIP